MNTQVAAQVEEKAAVWMFLSTVWKAETMAPWIRIRIRTRPAPGDVRTTHTDAHIRNGIYTSLRL